MDTISYNPATNLYAPDNEPQSLTGEVTIRIPNIPVTLTTGEECRYTLEEKFIVANLPDYKPGDYVASDYQTT